MVQVKEKKLLSEHESNIKIYNKIIGTINRTISFNKFKFEKVQEKILEMY